MTNTTSAPALDLILPLQLGSAEKNLDTLRSAMIAQLTTDPLYAITWHTTQVARAAFRVNVLSRGAAVLASKGSEAAGRAMASQVAEALSASISGGDERELVAKASRDEALRILADLRPWLDLNELVDRLV